MTAVQDPPLPTRAAAQPPDWRARMQPPLSASAAARGGWLVTLLVALLGGALRFVRLDLPAGRIFDEVYYACDAQNLLRAGVELASQADAAEPCTPDPGGAGAFIVHPPLGKWAIALGLRVFGVNELGWRFAAAVAGTLMIVVVVRVGRRMTGSTYLGALAGLLLSIDGLHFVQSRIAMLDIFVSLWVLVAFACLVVDRDTVRARLAALPDAALTGRWGPRLGLRPWRLAAGAALGAAVATKWSALYFVAALGLTALAWDVGARRTAGVRSPFTTTVLRSGPALVGGLLLLPGALYLASWAGWLLSDEGYNRDWAATHPTGTFAFLPDGLRALGDYHQQIYTFHSTLEASHPYQSHPLGWLVLARPVSYYYPQGIVSGQLGCEATTCSREVLALGNPAIWWASIPVVLALLWMWLARRDWRAASVLALFVVGIAPWIRDDLNSRTMFAFYALPSTSFLVLGLALVAGWALGGPGTSRRRKLYAGTGVGLYLGLAAGLFAFFYPVLAAVTLSYEDWFSRMWFSSWI